MKHLTFLISLILVSPLTQANQSEYSLSLGQKTMHFDMLGYRFDGIELYQVKATATAIYANLSLHKNQNITYSFEIGSFINGNAAAQENRTADNQGLVQENLDVEIEPSAYLNAYSQYTFRPGKTVKPFVLGGLTYVSTNKISESSKLSAGNTNTNSFSESSDSLGLMVGVGIDIGLFQDISFTFDYRVLQKVADQSTVEFNGAFKYQF